MKNLLNRSLGRGGNVAADEISDWGTHPIASTRIAAYGESSKNFMKPPLNIRDLAQWKIACIAIVTICHAILDSNLGIVDGARRLSKLRCEVRSENDLDFRKFVVIHSESDHFPIGNTRKEWSPENLRDLDAERSKYEAGIKDSAGESCRALLNKYDIPLTETIGPVLLNA